MTIFTTWYSKSGTPCELQLSGCTFVGGCTRSISLGALTVLVSGQYSWCTRPSTLVQLSVLWLSELY